MLKRLARRELKIGTKSAFPAISFLFPFSLRRSLQPPPLISPPSFPRNITSHPSPSNITTDHNTSLSLQKNLLLCHRDSNSSPPSSAATASTGAASAFQLLHRPTAVLLPPATPSSNRSSSSFLSHTNSSSREFSFSSAGICSFFQPGPVHASKDTAFSAPGKLSFPLILFSSPEFPSACRTFGLHAGGWGENNSPRWFLVQGQTRSGPVSFVAGPG